MCFVVFKLNKALEIVEFKKKEHSINRKLRTFEVTVKWNFTKNGRLIPTAKRGKEIKQP